VDHASGKRQIREPSLITAVNVRRNRTAIRALSSRGNRSRFDNRLHPVDRNPVDSKPCRNDRRRAQQRYRHCADSQVKPAPVGASTESKLSQSQTSTPIDWDEKSPNAGRRSRPSSISVRRSPPCSSGSCIPGGARRAATSRRTRTLPDDRRSLDAFEEDGVVVRHEGRSPSGSRSGENQHLPRPAVRVVSVMG
jgi:hypothetical protein